MQAAHCISSRRVDAGQTGYTSVRSVSQRVPAPPERVWTAPKPPHIWAGFGVRRTARSFWLGLRGRVGRPILGQTVPWVSARSFKDGLGGPVGDALMPYPCGMLPHMARDEGAEMGPPEMLKY